TSVMDGCRTSLPAATFNSRRPSRATSYWLRVTPTLALIRDVKRRHGASAEKVGPGCTAAAISLSSVVAKYRSRPSELHCGITPPLPETCHRSLPVGNRL